MSSELASTIVTNVLVYGLYGASALLMLFMARFSYRMSKLEASERVLRVERRKQEHRASLEANWPQYVIQEHP